MPPLAHLTPPLLGAALDKLPGSFSDDDLIAVLLRDEPSAYSREIGFQGAADGGGDGIARTFAQVVIALSSAPLSLRVKPALPGEWKRLDNVAVEDLPGKPDLSRLRRGLGRGPS